LARDVARFERHQLKQLPVVSSPRRPIRHLYIRTDPFFFYEPRRGQKRQRKDPTIQQSR
jgi:hypothetical protein